MKARPGFTQTASDETNEVVDGLQPDELIIGDLNLQFTFHRSDNFEDLQDQGVLQVALEVRKRAAAGETRFGPVLARAIAEWFATHATSMDHVLALYMKEVGFKPDALAAA